MEKFRGIASGEGEGGEGRGGEIVHHEGGIGTGSCEGGCRSVIIHRPSLARVELLPGASHRLSRNRVFFLEIPRCSFQPLVCARVYASHLSVLLLLNSGERSLGRYFVFRGQFEWDGDPVPASPDRVWELTQLGRALI